MRTARSPESDADAVRHGRGKFACMAAAYTLGVFNDNFFKQAALVLAVAAGRNAMQGFALAVFTVPFILFSAPAGWMADRFSKSHVVIGAKAFELLAMLAGAAGIYHGHWPLIFTMLAIMGLQATFFSPALNGSLPELYPEWYIPRANGILRMLVTVAILSGIALAGVALDVPGEWRGMNRALGLVGIIVVAVSGVGLLVSLGVPHRPAANPSVRFPWDGPLNTLRELRRACADPLLAVTIAIDVFVWFVGSVTVLVINPMGIQQFGLSKTLTSGLIVSQLLGIGIGGLAVGKFAGGPRWHRVLLPATVFMGWAMMGITAVPWLAASARVPALFGLTLAAGVAGGLILIPVESFLQVRPPAERKGTVLSAVNFVVFGGAAAVLVRRQRPECLDASDGRLRRAGRDRAAVGAGPRVGLSPVGVPPMMIALVCEWLRGLLRLRYRIQVTGLAEVAARGTRGILFLPNHPALIDPPILLCELHRRFRPRPLADKDQIDRPVVRSLVRLLRAFPMPDPAVYGQASQADVEGAIAACVEALRRGENVLIYPAGQTMRRRTSDLAGNSAVETILREAPQARVVLVRTTGLWGSAFSRASGRTPRLGPLAFRLLGAVLANGVFFGPRRAVSIELVEPADLPRRADRATLNRYLETFYNHEAPPNTYVPYTHWERGGRRTLPEPEGSRAASEALAEIPVATRDLVMRHLQEVTGLERIRPEDHLARDLGLDSLALVDLAMWVEHEFGFPVGSGAGLERVEDLLLAARGEYTATAPVELKPVPAAWFKTCRPGGRISLPEGDTLLDVLIGGIRQAPAGAVLADQAGGVRTYRDVVTGILVFKPVIEALEGDHVGIMLPASPAAGILYFAVLAAGKIPVMVNWTVGHRNMAHSLDLLGVRHVLTAGALLAKLDPPAGGQDTLSGRFILLEEVVKRIGRCRRLAAWARSRVGWAGALRPARRRETAVVLFTSGSESLPKAVPLTHANILANLRDLCRVFEFHHDDRLVGMLPPFHSFGLVVTTVLPLLGGVPVVYHPNPTEGALLARLIEAYKVTLLVGTPTFLNGIVRGVRAGELDRVRRVISGAEKCPEPLYALVGRLWPHAHLVEGYGITECSPVVSLNDEQAPQAGTIGRVLPSVEYAVVSVDGDGRVPPGRPGLLLVRGPSIFGGYLNYEGASPFVEFEGKSWYRTGDLVSEAPDGVLTFAGRLKRFVKLGGEMISLPAIEEVLNRKYARASDDEPVLAVESTPVELNPELVLFTVRDIAREEANRCIREAGLSALHTLRAVIKVESIPLLGTGKTDYRALKARLG